MSSRYILAIDQGTSGTKSVIFDCRGRIVAKAAEPLKSYFPQAGFVEQDPEDICRNVITSVEKCLSDLAEKTSGSSAEIACCGISNQRETFVLWDESGEPLCNAVVWQCKRSVDICNRLKGSELDREIVSRTGLIVDPYFSGTKLIWLYENDSRVRDAVDAGKAYFGTVDTWLLYRLTERQSYLTDHTNASRTLLFNIHDLGWDATLIDRFNLKNLNLPQVRASGHGYGQTDFEGLLPNKIDITAMIGDSHAAAFGEGCFGPGMAKATMGTGSSILLNTGSEPVRSKTGMVTTICWSAPERMDYALEGIIVTCGATINWLRDQMGLFANSSETERMALSVEDNNGVYLIPAFSGLGAPHWKMDARAAIMGLTLGCDKNHVVRAALESIPFQIRDVISAMEADSGIVLKQLKVDGGIAANQFVMQLLADLLNANVVNIGMEEVSALGAAYMAGLRSGIFRDIERLKGLNEGQNQFSPGKDAEKALSSYGGWQGAVKRLP